MTRLAFSLGSEIDVTGARERFARTGRVRIPALLPAALADALHDHLRARNDWRQVLNSGDKVLEIDRDVRAHMPAEQRSALDEAVYGAARDGFQYRFETLRVPDEAAARAAAADPLADFAAWLSGDEVLSMLRTVTGSPAIAFADAQGTAYSPGDFLTGHDDKVDGKLRHAAYVFGLNPVWRTEWGGLLLFHEQGGEVAGQTPGFNTLDLFRVGWMHSVSEVTRASPYRRYSVTGWLRGR